MEFIEIGDRLKTERKRRNLSMEQVMADTKLSRSNLEAMEAGDFNRLPHPVYAKGFVKNYANYLGLDGEELASYLDELIPGQKQEAEREGVESFDSPEIRSVKEGKKSWPSIVLLLLLAAAMVGLVFYFNSGGTEQPATHGQAPASQEHAAAPSNQPGAPVSEQAGQDYGSQDQMQQDQTQEAPLQQAMDEVASELETVSEDVAEGVMDEARSLAQETGSSQPATQGAAAAGEDTASAVAEAQELNAQGELAVAPKGATAELSPQTAQPPAQAAPVAPQATGADILRQAGQQGEGSRVFSLIAKPDDASWMQVRIDDGPVKEYILRDGAGMNFNFSDTLYVRLGNGGGVTAYLDGKEYPINADKGQVRTLIIPE